jgi:hypothetical protein
MRLRRQDPADMFPVVLSAAGSVAVGSNFTPDADELQNNFDRDIQIEELRFITAVRPANGGAAGMGALGGLVRTQIKMGRLDLTNGFIPIWLLGTRYQRMMESMVGTNNLSTWDYRRWKFAKPLVVPAGASLMPSFSFLTPTGNSALAFPGNSPLWIWMAMVGRSLPNDFIRPARINVPYATAWLPRINEQQSSDDALTNKLSSPLYVQRFIGRVAVSLAGQPDAEVWFENDGPAPAVKITGGNGYDAVGDFTPWRDVFQPARCSLEAGVTVEPREWFNAAVDSPPRVLGAGPYGIVMPMISMVGYREEELVL